MASLIDLHTHTSHSSRCSLMTASQLIEAAIEAGLDGVAVPEHFVIEGAAVAQDFAQREHGFPVYRGVEASVGGSDAHARGQVFWRPTSHTGEVRQTVNEAMPQG